MKNNQAPFLLLALGNDLLGDDGVALAAARVIKKHCPAPWFDIVESSEAGLALMEIMTGYAKVLLLDSVQTGQSPIGTVLEFRREDLQRIVAPSPHYAGIPEVLDMAGRLAIPFPEEIRILALEVSNPLEFGEEFTPAVQKGLPLLIEQAKSVLTQWGERYSCTNIR